MFYISFLIHFFNFSFKIYFSVMVGTQDILAAGIQHSD